MTGQTSLNFANSGQALLCFPLSRSGSKKGHIAVFDVAFSNLFCSTEVKPKERVGLRKLFSCHQRLRDIFQHAKGMHINF